MYLIIYRQVAPPTPHYNFPMIPSFTIKGILPPYMGDPTAAFKMNPYRTTMQSFVQMFGYTPERIKIIQGLLDYRAELLSLGLTGFQWLSGSFVEKVELIRNRPPGDVDVISIINRPEQFASFVAWSEFIDEGSRPGELLFDARAMKKEFCCDAYTIDMNEPGDAIVESTRFWIGLFTHQKLSDAWKGIVAVELDAQQDVAARSMLASLVTALPTTV